MAINICEYALTGVPEDARSKWLDEVCNGAHSSSIDRLLSQPLAEDFKLQDAPSFFSQALPGAIVVKRKQYLFDLLDTMTIDPCGAVFQNASIPCRCSGFGCGIFHEQ